jgi:hypothetical protein
MLLWGVEILEIHTSIVESVDVPTTQTHNLPAYAALLLRNVCVGGLAQ